MCSPRKLSGLTLFQQQQMFFKPGTFTGGVCMASFSPNDEACGQVREPQPYPPLLCTRAQTYPSYFSRHQNKGQNYSIGFSGARLCEKLVRLPFLSSPDLALVTKSVEQ